MRLLKPEPVAPDYETHRWPEHSISISFCDELITESTRVEMVKSTDDDGKEIEESKEIRERWRHASADMWIVLNKTAVLQLECRSGDLSETELKALMKAIEIIRKHATK